MKHWRSWTVDAAVIFLLAAALIAPLFRAGYMDNWGSIDSTFIADARFLVDHWPHPLWQPNWYMGTRWDFIYPPALRYATALLSMGLGVDTARAYHLYTASMACLGFVGVYALIRAGSGSRAMAWWGALASMAVSPGFLFFRNFVQDYRASRFMPIRLGLLVRYGEGPHMSAFALIPFAMAAAWFGLRRGRPWLLVLSGVISAAAVANNFYGAVALAICFPLLAWTVFLVEREWRVWARAALVAGIAYGLSAFWLTLLYVRLTQRNLRLVADPGNGWSLWVGVAVCLAFAVVTWRYAWGQPEREWTTFCSGLLLIMGLIVLGDYYLGFRVTGDSRRLVPEFELAFLMGALLLLQKSWRWGWVGRAAVVLVFTGCFYVSKGWIRHAHQILPANSDPEARVEKRIADWVYANAPGQRAMTNGSIRFWFNTWHDLPQLGGGSDQGMLNLMSYAAQNDLIYNREADGPILWARATATDLLIVPDETSAEIYHDYVNPHRFEGKLETVYDDHAGNRIYRVPRRYPGLARVVDASIYDLEPPRSAVDYPALERYLAAVEQGPDVQALFSREGPEEMRVQARVDAGQRILIQETFDHSWRAEEGGKEVAKDADPLGFLLLDPGPGQHDIRLRFTVPLENQIGRVITGITVLTIGLFAIQKLRAYRAAERG